MQYEQLYSFIMDKLKADLPTYLTYHNAQHTENVIKASIHLASMENVDGKELILLKTAALMHDTGFLESHITHEILSCKFANQYLPDFNYIQSDIDLICQMIMATRLPQLPKDPLSRILCDADLYYLGTEVYEEYAEKLFNEFLKLKVIKNRAEWNRMQLEFLSSHKYFTPSAIINLEKQKQSNLDRVIGRDDKTKPQENKKLSWADILQDGLMMALGVTFSGMALKCFLVPNHFFDGGITGISLLIHEIYHIDLTLLIILFNLPLIAVGYYSVSKSFAYRTLISVVLFGLVLYLFSEVPLTLVKLFISVFVGAFLGIGIGLVMRAGAALDGIEVLAHYTLKRTSFTITEIILGINILIFSIAALQFGLETALYSILTYFTATRCIDYVVEGLQAKTGVTIISGKSEIIKYQLVNHLGRGITVYKGERGFLPGKFEESADVDIIFTVITRLELRKLKNLIKDVDPNAFVFANTIKDTSGGILNRRHQH